jgi:hypothetical protein
MSGKERERLKIMGGVAEEELTLAAAAGLMGVCYRQSKRIWRRYQDNGDAGLVHHLRGKPSPRNCGCRFWPYVPRNATRDLGQP